MALGPNLVVSGELTRDFKLWRGVGLGVVDDFNSVVSPSFNPRKYLLDVVLLMVSSLLLPLAMWSPFNVASSVFPEPLVSSFTTL